jgi:hypothetical protein
MRCLLALGAAALTPLLLEILHKLACCDSIRVCHTCQEALNRIKVPLRSPFNNVVFNTELPCVVLLPDHFHERLISPRIAWQSIIVRKYNQGATSTGSLVNVMSNVTGLVEQLPRVNNFHMQVSCPLPLSLSQ